MTDPLSESAPVREGEVLAGKYRVDRVLGVGGMGVVVAATHMQLEQKVALKFMLPWALSNPGAVARFEREARAAVRLKSDHVARVRDVGVLESGSPYMVMDYLEGIDLGDLIHETPGHKVSVGDAVDYVLQACEAVAEAHAVGIVHRDLKPKNLFLTRGNDGNALVKVLDFGISKMNSPGGDMSLTSTSEIIGSPNYMSPEQLRASRNVDERTDIWALGVILYELLAGSLPFVAQTLTQLTAMVLQDPPAPLRAIRPDVPPGLVQVIELCLEKDVAKRYPNVVALAGGLEKFAPEHARGLAQRVRRVADASRTGGSLNRVSVPSPSQRVVGGTGGTSVAWGETEVQKERPKWKVPAIIAAGVVVLVGGGLALFATHKNPPVSNGAPVVSVSTPPLSTPTSVQAPDPVAPDPTLATAGGGSATARPPNPITPVVRPPHVPIVRPPAHKDASTSSGDDLPSDRH